ncbi:MAG: Nif3-like dinuclear metal center hexameric protein [Candidatus Contendobacter odensis]|uniref:GTP cyclohydrolase 1 type 2 homolog n=1 Tax=Candidatus Contendibacter odensensis TaxID=1400860 RepID=A0A2G6PG57_9GAMM|nr:MAG: Nif3-like dinuclear metal center hexameric protein [Candidatus Contendobacter odensis]
MQLKKLVNYTNGLLAIDDFNDYCPNGLQVEGCTEVNKLVGGVTACQQLLEAAVAQDADAVLVHHGYFWKGEDPRLIGMKYRRLATLIRHDISLIAYHLPLDAHAVLGNNAQLAQLLGLTVTDVVGSRGHTPGLVMLGEPPCPLEGKVFRAQLAAQLGREPLYIAGSDVLIRRVAWCTGGAQSFIEMAADAGVDAFLTGEVSEQTVHFARENGLHFFAAGHHATERYGVQALGQHLAQQFDLQFYFVDIDNPA